MANDYVPGEYFAQFLNQLPQMYRAKQSADLQRERFEYYKNKDAQAASQAKLDEQYKKNVSDWSRVETFAKEMPFGQQANFMRKQLDTLPTGFVESQNLNKFIDNYQIIEDNEVDQIKMYDNARDEDNPGKIRYTASLMDDPKRKRQLLSDAKSLESKFVEQKPFDMDRLTIAEQRNYKAYSKLLTESEAGLMKMNMPGLSAEQKKIYVESDAFKKFQKDIPFLREKIEPLIKKGAPMIMPEFAYTPESLQYLTENPDMMSSFFGSADDDMDAFVRAQKGEPEPKPEPEPEPEPEPKTTESMWEPQESRIMVAGPGGVKTPKTVLEVFN